MVNRHSLIVRTFVQMTSIMLLIQAPALGFEVPTPVAPRCSINIAVAPDSLSESHVVNVSDGVYDRCASIIIPDREEGEDQKLPILFDFHGSGGNAMEYPGRKAGEVGNTWADIAVAG